MQWKCADTTFSTIVTSFRGMETVKFYHPFGNRWSEGASPGLYNHDCLSVKYEVSCAARLRTKPPWQGGPGRQDRTAALRTPAGRSPGQPVTMARGYMTSPYGADGDPRLAHRVVPCNAMKVLHVIIKKW